MNDVFSKSFELDHGELKLRQRIAVLEMVSWGSSLNLASNI